MQHVAARERIRRLGSIRAHAADKVRLRLIECLRESIQLMHKGSADGADAQLTRPDARLAMSAIITSRGCGEQLSQEAVIHVLVQGVIILAAHLLGAVHHWPGEVTHHKAGPALSFSEGKLAEGQRVAV
eukprot:2482236-Prymnesium_polylepis.2